MPLDGSPCSEQTLAWGLELVPRKAPSSQHKLNPAQVQALQHQLEAHSDETLLEHIRA